MKDKVLHMAAYGLLAALVFRACRASWSDRWSTVQLIVVSVCFATFFGVSDEFHQSFVAARQADGYDVLADFLGGVIGALGYMKAMSRHPGAAFPSLKD